MEMPTGTIWSGRAPVGQGLEVVCRSGSLWVTGECTGDYVLGPGEFFRTMESDRVVVEALGPSRARVMALESRGTGEARWWSFLKGMRLAPSP
jgi:hypothetical protein